MLGKQCPRLIASSLQSLNQFFIPVVAMPRTNSRCVRKKENDDRQCEQHRGSHQQMHLA